MAPRLIKKRNSVASKSTSEQAVSDKKPLENGKKAGSDAESTLEEVVSDKKIVEDKKDGGAKQSVSTPVVKKKPCSWLKIDMLEPQTGNKSSVESSKQGKEANSRTQVQTLKDNKRKRKGKGNGRGNNEHFREKHIDSRPEKKEKRIINDRHDNTEDTDEEAGKSFGGLIFMCNAKTKPDCFGYQVLGVPVNKKEVVMNIKPGLKLFLYDYDLKLMYGVYEASSAGGMKLEPAAFGGGFPAQVRFIVHKDCLPLPESMFKKAIIDSYDERTRKFKTELTVKQVKRLLDLFSPTPWLHRNSQPMVQGGNQNIFQALAATLSSEESFRRQIGKTIPLDHEKQSGYHVYRNPAPPQDPLFLTEQEYRNNGLRQGRPLLPTTAGENVNQTREPCTLDQELKQYLRDPPSSSIASAVQQREADQLDPFSLSEKEYRLYGLRGPQQTLTAASPAMTTNILRDSAKEVFDPYDDSTTSLVNRYLAMPRMTAIPPESYHLAGRESYINNLNHTSDVNAHPRTMILHGERAFVAHSLHDQSAFNQRPYSLNAFREPSVLNQGFPLQRETDLASAPVSSRYSFAGPSLSQHR